MRIKNILSVIVLYFLASCNDEPHLLPTIAEGEYGDEGFYILCEGLFNQNNSTLSYFNNGKLQKEIFYSVNGRKLGDTANDMLVYGSKMYIAVSVSSTIEILDASTCRSKKVINMKKDGKSREPRNLTTYKGHVYVCSFDGTVSRIDTTTMIIDADIKVGRNPDGITCAAGNLYVSNSGGLDASNLDSTVSVIDIATFREIKRINVGLNPGAICSDGNGNVFVISRGAFDYDKMDYTSCIHRIDAAFNEITDTYNIPALGMNISGSYLYLYGFEDNNVRIMDIPTGNIINDGFIVNDIPINKIYSVDINIENGNVYVCDAHDYVVPGTVYCYDKYGNLKYSVQGVGINPNGIQFGKFNSQGNSEETTPQSLATKVFEYCPAPGQFVNVLPEYNAGDDAATMYAKCSNYLKKGYLVTLGGFGGYITVGFDTEVRNIPDKYDFKIEGNSFNGNSEQGVVEVSADINHNGLPDDPWYEIAGSEHLAGNATSGYSITYIRPSVLTDTIRWRDNKGSEGSIDRLNSYHPQSYWPLWQNDSILTFSGTLLKDNLTFNNGKWTTTAFEWGYADNSPNSSEGSRFKIEWAVDSDGNPIALTHINFVRIHTAVNNKAETIGELSTEVSRIINLNPQK